MLLTCTLPSFAASSPSVTTGYTSQGNYYESITLYDSIMPLADTDTITLTQEITYSGIVTPSASIPWSKTIDGKTYSGTLYLQSFYYTSTKTIAIYKGTLTARYI